MKKPTGKPGDLLDRHFRCLAIERRIQDRANAAILGVDSAESSHHNDDGSNGSYIDNDGADDAYEDGAAEDDDVGGPADEVNEEVAAANANVGEMNAAVARGVDAARPPSLPAFVGGGLLNRASSAVSSSASQGGGGGSKSTAPRRSPTSSVLESGGGGGGKTKNSTNRDRVSLSKSIQKMAESLEGAGGEKMG